MKKAVINESFVQLLLTNPRAQHEFPFLKIASQQINRRAVCSNCKKRINATERSRLYRNVKLNLLSLSPDRVRVLKNITGFDKFIIFMPVSGGTVQREI